MTTTQSNNIPPSSLSVNQLSNANHNDKKNIDSKLISSSISFLDVIITNDKTNSNNNSTTIANDVDDTYWYNKSNEYVSKSKEIFTDRNGQQITQEFINVMKNTLQQFNNHNNTKLVIKRMIRTIYILLNHEIQISDKPSIFQMTLSKLTTFALQNNTALVYTFEELFKRIHEIIIQSNMNKKIMSEFWKFLCNLSIEISQQDKKVDGKIILKIIKIFINYLKDGVDNMAPILISIVSSNDNTKTKNILQHMCTLLNFLLLRLSCFIVTLFHGHSEDIKEEVMAILSYFMKLRGLKFGYMFVQDTFTTTNHYDENVMAVLQQLEEKVQNIFLSILPKSDIYIESLMQIAQKNEFIHSIVFKPINPSLSKQYLLQASSSYGKLLLCNSYVRYAIQQNNDKYLLTIPKIILFHIIPQSYAYLISSSQYNQELVSNTIPLLVDILLYHYIHENAIHYTIVQWLYPTANSIHPFTFEILKKIICNYYILQNSSSQQHLLQLLLALVIDYRTNYSWKGNLCKILEQLKYFMSDERKGYIHECILLYIFENDCLEEDVKIYSILLQDMNIAHIMDTKNGIMKHNFHSYITNFYQLLSSNQQRKSMQTISTFVSTIILALNNETNTTNSTNIFMKYFSIPYWSYIQSWIQYEYNKWKQSSHNDITTSICFLKSMQSIMQYNHQHFPIDVFETFIGLLHLWNQTLLHSKKKSDDISILQLEIIMLCSHIGKVVPCNLDNRSNSLQVVKSTFHALLSSTNWLIVSTTLSSFEEFVSTLHTSYKNILPSFIPDCLQYHWICRLRGEVDLPKDNCITQWKFEHNLNDCIILQKKYYYKPMSTTPKQELSSILLKANQSKFYAWDRVGQQRVLLFFPDDDGATNNDKSTHDNSTIQDIKDSMGGIIRPMCIDGISCLNDTANNHDTTCSISLKL